MSKILAVLVLFCVVMMCGCDRNVEFDKFRPGDKVISRLDQDSGDGKPDKKLVGVVAKVKNRDKVFVLWPDEQYSTLTSVGEIGLAEKDVLQARLDEIKVKSEKLDKKERDLDRYAAKLKEFEADLYESKAESLKTGKAPNKTEIRISDHPVKSDPASETKINAKTDSGFGAENWVLMITKDTEKNTIMIDWVRSPTKESLGMVEKVRVVGPLPCKSETDMSLIEKRFIESSGKSW